MGDWKLAHWILRVGLSLTFLYAGVDAIIHPQAWVGWFPQWVKNVSPIKDYPLVVLDGVVEVVIAGGLLTTKWVRPAAALATAMLLGILLFTRAWDVTFRDIGLFATALALAIAPGEQKSNDEFHADVAQG